jgi:hypothetical protein
LNCAMSLVQCQLARFSWAHPLVFMSALSKRSQKNPAFQLDSYIQTREQMTHNFEPAISWKLEPRLGCNSWGEL